MNYKYLAFVLSITVHFSCKKNEPEPTPQKKSEPKLIFGMKMNPNQQRVDAFGQPAIAPEGHGHQVPKFNGIAVHYIELSPNSYTQVGDGEVVYYGEETTAGGSSAIDFDKIKTVADGEEVFSIPLSKVAPKDYNYARVSVAYQNYDVDFRAN